MFHMNLVKVVFSRSIFQIKSDSKCLKASTKIHKIFLLEIKKVQRIIPDGIHLFQLLDVELFLFLGSWWNCCNSYNLINVFPNTSQHSCPSNCFGGDSIDKRVDWTKDNQLLLELEINLFHRNFSLFRNTNNGHVISCGSNLYLTLSWRRPLS